MRALADGLRRKADDEARIGLDLMIEVRTLEARVPESKLTVCDAPDDEAIERSADPDAVAQAAAEKAARNERLNHTRAATEKRVRTAAKSREQVADLWPKVWAEKTASGRQTTREEVAAVIAERLTAAGFKISPITAQRYAARRF